MSRHIIGVKGQGLLGKREGMINKAQLIIALGIITGNHQSRLSRQSKPVRGLALGSHLSCLFIAALLVKAQG